MKIKVYFLLLLITLSPALFVQAQNYDEPLVNDVLFVPCEEMPDLINNFYQDYRSLYIAYNIKSSPEYRERFVKFYNSYLGKLNDINYDALPHECKVDYILFKRDLKENIRLSEIETKKYDEVQDWFPFADKIFNTQKLRRKGIKLDAKNLALELDAMNNQIKNLQTELEENKDLSLYDIHTARTIIKDVRKAMKDVFDFYNGYDPLFSWWIPVPYKNLDSTLANYASEFDKKLESPSFLQDDSGIVGKPVGKEELVRKLNYNFIPYSPDQLIEIAQKELEWSQKEILQASKEMGFGDDWRAAS